MKQIKNLCVDVKVSKLQLFALKLINYPRVLLGLPVICPDWCVTIGKVYLK